MPQSTKIEYATVDHLSLDPKNPRLGRESLKKTLSPDDVLEIMQTWGLDELATSFCVNGFWPQEALIVVKEMLDGAPRLVVVEGNRRLAALKLLARAEDGEEPRWARFLEGAPKDTLKRLRDEVPYIEMPTRDSVRSYLGFRHVTGIREWRPAEKAQFIADLIDRDKLSYDDVRRRIGSKTPTVRQNYISYRLLLEMEEQSEKVAVDKVEDRFSVLYLSMRTEGVRTYLQIDMEADPATASKPVPAGRLKQLENFARWLFGDSKHEPLFTDSRKVDDFGRMLLSGKTIEYLERNEKPSFEVAKRMAGISESEVATHVETAADEAEEALRAAHLHKGSARVQEAVERLGRDAVQLGKLFPKIVDVMQAELATGTGS